MYSFICSNHKEQVNNETCEVCWDLNKKKSKEKYKSQSCCRYSNLQWLEHFKIIKNKKQAGIALAYGDTVILKQAVRRGILKFVGEDAFFEKEILEQLQKNCKS